MIKLMILKDTSEHLNTHYPEFRLSNIGIVHTIKKGLTALIVKPFLMV